MVKIGDEGQAMESLGTGVRWGLLPSLLLCFFAGGAGLQEKRGAGGNFNYLLFYLFYYGKR